MSHGRADIICLLLVVGLTGGARGGMRFSKIGGGNVVSSKTIMIHCEGKISDDHNENTETCYWPLAAYELVYIVNTILYD